MPQVIYAWNYVEWGGAQIHLLAIIREAVKTYDVTVILPRNSNKTLLKFIGETGASTAFFEDAVLIGEAVGLREKISRQWVKLKSEYALLKALKANGLDDASFLHVDLSPWQSLIALGWLSNRIPTFVTMHNSLADVSFARRLLWRSKLRIISRFRNFHAFASNKEAKSFFLGLYSQKKHDDIKITYTSVDPSEINSALERTSSKEEIFQKYGIPADCFSVFCVGQFIDRKGRWIFMEAARSVAKAHPDTVFVWISNSTPTESELAKAKSFGLGDKFILITSEMIGDEHVDLFELLKFADTFVLASEREGLPISILEAMALGVATISTRVNAIPEAIIDEETGLLVEPEDSTELTAAIFRLQADDSFRKRLSSKGRIKVLAEFNDKVIAKIALSAYESAIKNAD